MSKKNVSPKKINKKSNSFLKQNKMENNNKDPKEIFEGYNEKFDKNLITDHDYDGIKELDNPPPPWLMWLFYLTVFWSLGYVAYFHWFKQGPLQAEEYENEIAEAEKKYKDTKTGAFEIILLNDETSLAAGAATYAKSCTACHGQNGKGGIGVNLVDEEWIYGSDIKNVFDVIKNGTSKGMASFNSLPDKQILEVASFVLTELKK